MRSRNDELSTHAGKTGTQPLPEHRPDRPREAEVTDEELVERFRDGGKEWFDELVRRHQKRMYWLARRIVGNHDDADDVVQDVFLKVYHGLRKFRGESSFATWLYRITTNAAIGMQRRRRIVEWVGLEPSLLGGTSPEGVPFRDEYRPEEAATAAVSSGQDVPHSLEVEEQRAIIEKAIARLPRKQRLVFVLRYYEELPYAEISKILKTSGGGLKANYYHAVKKIATYVRRKYGL